MIKAVQVPATIAEFEGKNYMYLPNAGMWLILIQGSGWMYPTEDEIEHIEKLDYMIFNGESIH